MQFLAPYPQAVVTAAAAFAAVGIEAVKTDDAPTFLAKCQRANCVEIVSQANITPQLRRPGFSVGPGFFTAQRLENFLLDLRIYAAFGFLPR